MGEVWKARDAKLNRDVALKVLPEAFTRDSERIARLTREAQVLASLNHSNIAAIHGLEDSAVHALVLEFVDGPTLADRIAGRPLPIDEALSIARQLTDALEAAHGQGVIHRDLKPANIKVRPDGMVKVLDFGLAKALDTVPGPGLAHSVSPTITSPAMTRAGVVLGTAAYMSPEQARGRQADERSDIWAFGCVLFEMLTGRRVFEADEVSDTMAAVLRAEPSWRDLPATTPPSVRRLLQRCLEKDPKRRLADIRDARLEIDERDDQGAVARPSRFEGREQLAWGVAALGIVATALVGWLLWQRGAPPAQSSASQFVILPPERTSFGADATAAISPDGRSLVFTAAGAGEPPRLWVRSLDSLVATMLSGTDAARMPFWSPDSASIGFFAGGKLKRVDAQGGPVQTLADVDLSFQFGGTWNRDGVILFSPGFNRPIYRVSARGGGEPTPVTNREGTDKNLHGGPFFLPDGRHFLFSAARGPTNHDIQVASIDAPDGVNLLTAESPAVYASGYLLYLKDGALQAHPFDAATRTLTGEPVPVPASGAFVGDVAFSASNEGTLLHQPQSAQSELVWIDRKGSRVGVAAPASAYLDADLSKDGKWVAFTRWATTIQDVWVADLERQITSRFTTEPPLNNVPIWSPDNRTIAFATTRNGGLDIYQGTVGSTSDQQEMLRLSAPPIVFPSDWSRDGRYLMYYRSDPKSQLDTWVLPLAGDRTPTKLLGSGFNESQGQFAPNGKWIAYVSDESGQAQVWVQAFPTPARRIQVSTTGGAQPRWRPDGNELFYLAMDGSLMSVSVKAGDTFTAGTPRVLFPTRLDPRSLRQRYSVSPDGERFLFQAPVETAKDAMTVVLNWPALLREQR
jgi:Tol biopolymer transport system component